MSLLGWNASAAPRRVLVLGGIRSGKSEVAEALVSGRDGTGRGGAATAAVRYLATAAGAHDPEMAERIARHKARRPDHWRTEELGDQPERLPALIAGADPDETLLVDDLGGWLTATFDAAGWAPSATDEPVSALVEAVRTTDARLVLVSPEVGWSVVPATPAGRAFADAAGAANRALAEVCDAVVLVVAGQPVVLKELTTATAAPRRAQQAKADVDVVGATDDTAPSGEPEVAIEPGLTLPLPDEGAASAAFARLDRLDLPGAAGLGTLARAVRFAAATQGSAPPAPMRRVRAYLLRSDHQGGLGAGEDTARVDRRVGEVQQGGGAFGSLAADAGVPVTVVPLPPAGAVESGEAMDRDAVEAALRDGWRLADRAADEGCDAVVLGACGTGADAAATAVIAAVANTEPTALLAHVMGTPDDAGRRIDDAAWMARCVALRDALRRIDHQSRVPRTLLATLGGPDLAVATGLLLGAAARRTPVLLDGPVGVAAALLARDIAGQVRYWCLLVDDGGHPAVRLAARVLDLEPVVTLGLGLGEGAAALAALPLLRSALTVSALAGDDA